MEEEKEAPPLHLSSDKRRPPGPQNHEEQEIASPQIRKGYEGRVSVIQDRHAGQGNSSETESETDQKSYTEQDAVPPAATHERHERKPSSGSGEQHGFRERKDSDIDRAGSVLSSLLTRPGINSDSQTSAATGAMQYGSRYTTDNAEPARHNPETMMNNQEGVSNDGAHNSKDVRLPALAIKSGTSLPGGGFLRHGLPPANLQSQPQQQQLQRDASPMVSNAIATAEMSNRPRPEVHPSNNRGWNPARPHNLENGEQTNSPNRPPSYESKLHVSTTREDYDYPTYQPPESFVGQRIAKTFAGHGRFVGQVVKYNAQTELFTVVYADGDTEELTRENTMNLLIEDKRIQQNKPRETIRRPQTTTDHPGFNTAPSQQQSLVASAQTPLPVSEREMEILNTLFEKHAWPVLSENGWKSEVRGSSYYFYPSWSGKNTREPDYFNSVLSTMKYIAMHGDLLRMCFPVEVHATIFSILEPTRNSVAPPKRMAEDVSQQQPLQQPPSMKRIKAESPHHHPRADAPFARRLEQPYYGEGPPQQQPYREAYPNDMARRPAPAEHPVSSHANHPYARQEEDAFNRGPPRAYAPSPQRPISPTSKNGALRYSAPRNPHYREEAFEPPRQHQQHPMGPNVYTGPPQMSQPQSPRRMQSEMKMTSRPPMQQHHHYPSSNQDSRPMSSQSPSIHHHSHQHHPSVVLNNSARQDVRYTQPPPPRPLGQRANTISMSDLDKSAPTQSVGGGRPQLPDHAAPRIRMFANEQPLPAVAPPPAYPRIRREWDDRYGAPEDPNASSSAYRQQEAPPPAQDRMYPSDRYGSAPSNPPDAYYDPHHAAQQNQRGFHARLEPFQRGPDPSTNPDRVHDYQYNRRLQ
ncbi:hypothetical protein AC1031_008929 [Aphanomyces cochlioides]|nr:hypothetical protein AC1031_008929 [Aphanomyces cochlioides]